MKQLMLPYFHSHTTVFVRHVKCTIFMCDTPLSTEADHTIKTTQHATVAFQSKYCVINENERKVIGTFDILCCRSSVIHDFLLTLISKFQYTLKG